MGGWGWGQGRTTSESQEGEGHRALGASKCKQFPEEVTSELGIARWVGRGEHLSRGPKADLVGVGGWA